MKLHEYVREGDWSTVAGYGLFVGLLTAGYYYNITFVQLGLLDLGERHVGLTRSAVSVWLAVLAVATFLVAALVGYAMDRRGWSSRLDVKRRLMFGVVLVQLLLLSARASWRSRRSSSVAPAG